MIHHALLELTPCLNQLLSQIDLFCISLCSAVTFLRWSGQICSQPSFKFPRESVYQKLLKSLYFDRVIPKIKKKNWGGDTVIIQIKFSALFPNSPVLSLTLDCAVLIKWGHGICAQGAPSARNLRYAPDGSVCFHNNNWGAEVPALLPLNYKCTHLITNQNACSTKRSAIVNRQTLFLLHCWWMKTRVGLGVFKIIT